MGGSLEFVRKKSNAWEILYKYALSEAQTHFVPQKIPLDFSWGTKTIYNSFSEITEVKVLIWNLKNCLHMDIIIKLPQLVKNISYLRPKISLTWWYKEQINKYKNLRRSRRKVQERVKCLILKDVFEQRRISLDLNVNKSEKQEVDHRLTQYFFLKTEIMNVNNDRN